MHQTTLESNTKQQKKHSQTKLFALYLWQDVEARASYMYMYMYKCECEFVFYVYVSGYL